jgi:cytochrome c oxidase cbb3-type subunit 3
VKSKVTVTLASGQTIKGALEYLDEFTVGLIGPTGVYQSWRIGNVQYKVDAPVNAHVELLSKYTDADIHNLMAYLQTLR